MEKKSSSMVMLTAILVATALVIPMPGIIAENNDSISKEIQWCCSYNEEEDDDSQNLLILNSLLKNYLAI